MVRLKVMAMSICGSDLFAYKQPHARMIPPLVPGHEFCGIVDAIGPGVKKYKVGQRVAVNPVLNCGECFHCKEGRPNMCPNRHNTGTTVYAGRWDGGLREYTYTPEFSLSLLPDNMDFVNGTLIEPVAVCLHAASRGYTPQEKCTVIVGSGPIGLLVLRCLKAMGVKQVICTDVIQKRLDMALEWGADIIVNSAIEDPVEAVKRISGERNGADRVILCTDPPVVFLQGIKMCRMGGKVVLVSHIHDEIPVKPEMFLTNGIDLLSSVTFLPEHFSKAMELIRSKQVDPAKLITSIVPFEDGKMAFDTLADPQNEQIKILIKMHNW